MTSNCIFCKILKKEIPAFVLAETEHALAFMDVFPLSRGHCLVIPKVHGEKLHDLDEHVVADMGRVLSRVSKAAMSDTYNVLQNNGKLAHQEVPHVHFHLIPKYAEEEQAAKGKGLGIGWPNAKGDMDELKAVAEEIKARIAANAAAAPEAKKLA